MVHASQAICQPSVDLHLRRHRYLVIGAYVGVVTVAAFIWWYLAFEGGPRMSWRDLRAAQHCDASDAAAAAARGFACSAFQDLRPSTVSMSVLVMVEMFNALNALSENRSLAAVPPWRNPWLLAAIALSVLLHLTILCASAMLPVLRVVHHRCCAQRAADTQEQTWPLCWPLHCHDAAKRLLCRYIPGLAGIFGVTALSWAEWRVIVLLSAPVIATDEVLKAVSRHIDAPHAIGQVLSRWYPRNLGKFAVFAGAATEKERLK
jgi:P-type Ca2+ transporter type 2A